MEQIGDLERLISRVSVGRTNARDLKQLELSLAQIPRVKIGLSSSEILLIKIPDPKQQYCAGMLLFYFLILTH